MSRRIQFWGILACSVLAPARAVAQVGHAPERSPYRDLVAKQAAQIVGGYLSGSRGRANVGPSGGPLIGIRYDHVVGTAADIQVGISYAHLQRYFVDPSKPPQARTTGPAFQDLAMMETGVSLIMMGRKTWRGISPYIGATLGVAFETGLATEPSGYQFGTKVMLTPHLGFKWFPVQAFAIKVEGRDYVWKLTYPGIYAISQGTGIDPVLSTPKLNDWTHHPTLLFSVGYTFTF